MNTLKDRIKKLRKTLDLTQQEFADKLNIKRNTVATYERGKSNPSDAAVVLICKTFNVSETWLRTEEGEMFVELPENEALAAQIQAFLQGGSDSFREKLISLLLRLPTEHWEMLENYALELVGGSTTAPALVDTRPREEKPVREKELNWRGQEIDMAAIDKQVELYRQQLLLEEEREKQAPFVSGSGAG